MTLPCEANRSAVLAAARHHLSLPLVDLWLGYLAVGGDRLLSEVRGWLGGDEMPDREYDLLAQALNDVFTARGMDHPVAYSDDRDK